MVGAAVAHDEKAERSVRQLAADVHDPWRALKGVEILRIAGPAEIHALCQNGARNILDAFHQIDQVVLGAGLHWGEPDAAIAEHHGGDAVP